MGKVEEALRSMVVRAVGRELKGRGVPVARDMREIKRALASLARSVAALQEIARELAREKQAERQRLEAPEEEVKAARLSAALIRKLRMRLKLTQGQLATVLGVASGSVVAWEAGRSAPRGANRMALVALRKLGRRDVERILAEKAEVAPVEKAATGNAPRRRAKSRKGSRRR